MNNRARRKITIGIIEKAWLANPAGSINEICQAVEVILGGPMIDVSRRKITSFRPKTLPRQRWSRVAQNPQLYKLCPAVTIRTG